MQTTLGPNIVIFIDATDTVFLQLPNNQVAIESAEGCLLGLFPPTGMRIKKLDNALILTDTVYEWLVEKNSQRLEGRRTEDKGHVQE